MSMASIAFNVDTSATSDAAGAQNPDPSRTRCIVTQGAQPSDTTASLGQCVQYQYRVEAFRIIATMAERLQLVTATKERANEVYQKVSEIKSVRGVGRGKNRDAILAGACLYIACRQEGTPRTFKEIEGAIGAKESSMRDIGRAVSEITKHAGGVGLQSFFPDRGSVRSLHPKDYVERFCQKMDVSETTVTAILDAVDRLKPDIDLRKPPMAIACGVIYMIAAFSDERKTYEDIALASYIQRLLRGDLPTCRQTSPRMVSQATQMHLAQTS